MLLTFNPTEDEILIRTRERVKRLRQAIDDENRRPNANHARVKELQAEVDGHVARIHKLLDGVI